MFTRIESMLVRAGVSLPLFGLEPSLSVRVQNSIDRYGKRSPAYLREMLQGNPLPPPSVMNLVQGNTDPVYYIQNGTAAFETVTETLQKSWVDVNQMERILDFGCGCGRVLRHWKPYAHRIDIHGTDYNPELVYWSHKLCKHATVGRNSAAPPLAYPDNYFSYIYALSVFTHLTVELQDAWMDECFRVLKPGGVLLFTTHGDYTVPFMPEEKRPEYNNGQVVVINEDNVGENVCAAFHPLIYVQTHMLRKYKLLQFYPRAGRGVPWQDVYLVQKPIPSL